jgi:putative PIN family toxin of toxin-antitoxin system
MKSTAVFDCMLFLQGAGRPEGPARACFRLVDEDRITLCISADILAEVRDVLTRPKTMKKFPLLTPEWVESFLQKVQSKAVAVDEVPRIYALERDRKDEPYLNLALETRARYLVSRDRDLLDLMSDEAFSATYPELIILDPPSFLQAIARDMSPGPESVPPPEPDQ